MIQPDSEQNDILIVDDTPENLNVLMQILTKQGYRVRPVLNGDLALQVVRKSLPDLILLDIMMPGTDGYEVCRRLKAQERTRDIPIIFISALGEAADKVRAFELGGVDYITKPFQEKEVLARVKTHLSLRNMQIQMQTQNYQLQQEIREREQTERALRDSEEKLSAIVNAAADAIILVDDQGKIIYSNPASVKIFGYTVEELKGEEMHTRLIPTEFHETYRKEFEAFQRTGQIPAMGKTSELMAVRKDGTAFSIEISISALKMNDRWHAAGIVRDVTGKKEMQEQIVRARKLESMGILAGGIAHDFNNLLSVILGNINLAEEDMDPDAKGSGFLEEAEIALLKAKSLTRQLITFSKGGEPFKKIGSVSDMLRQTTNLALSGYDVRTEFFIPPDLWRVEFDEDQMRQAIRNLIVNAAESMHWSGSLVVIAENTRIGSEPSEKSLPLLQGDYVRIIIQDQGVGIPQENLTRIFDPYFSTRDRGTQKGMGLGLTTTWSVISRHGGHITVASEIGTGTIFTIYLPAYEKGTEEIKEQGYAKKSQEEKPAVREGRILVMDDEEMVRALVGHMLNRIGYDAEFASDGSEAIELYEIAMNSGKPFDAVILDLTIKGGIGGIETIRSLLRTDPQVRAIVSSGYSDNSVITDFRKYGFTGALPKPYTMKDLADSLK